MKRISVDIPKVLVPVSEPDRTAVTPTTKARPDIISGWQKTWAHVKIRWTLLRVIMRCYRNPLDWFRGLRYFIRLRRSIWGNYRVRKMVKVGAYHYMGLHVPGWNDATYRRYIAKALLDFKPHRQPAANIELGLMAITKKCPLQCEHCSAGDTLNMKDELGAEEYETLIDQLEAQGVFQINFTGGEPLVKFDLLERLVSHMSPGVKAWVNTSGYRLTADKAQRLKAAGLTGVVISLDHYEEAQHNAFRNYKDAWYWAMEAAENSLDAGLVVAYSVCLSEELSTEAALLRYMTLARNMGAHFVQFLEPRAVGHYAGKDVGLSKAAIERIEAFFLKMNFGKDHTDYPLIAYHGYYQRRVGCFSAGKKSIYIDADGHLNACPFCLESYGNLLEGDWEEKMQAMVAKGCTADSVRN